jgi:hypothetical protein
MVWAQPILIDSLDKPTSVTPLERRNARTDGLEPGYREALLQGLIHSTPECLPIQEIEPAFVGLRSVCTELQLKRGMTDRYADNLLINPDGRICLVECKLAHNAESDRDVLAQLIDYAITLAELDYEGLRTLVRKATRQQDGDPIVDAVLGPEADIDRREDLIAGIERSLKRSEFLLLIVGDRIRENTESMVQLLQERVNLGFTFGLVEMLIFSAGSAMAGYLVQPRVLLRTKIITRTVFVASDSQGAVTVEKVEQTEPASSLSEQAFYAGLATVDPAFPAGVRSLLARLTDLGCETQLLRNYNIYLDDGLGGRLTVLSIAPAGTVTVWSPASRDVQLGEPVGHTYMKRVAAILPGGRVKDDLPNPASWNIRVDGKVAIDLHLLLAHQDAWLSAISELRDWLKELQDKRDSR